MAARKKSRSEAVNKTTKRMVSAPLSDARRYRMDLMMNEARNAGLIGGPKDTVIRGRVSKSLVKAAKKYAGVTSDTELLAIALANLALEDDFGEQLLKLKGSVDPDIDLEF